ncbi:MAG TPA: alanine racemase [Armatimonadota bacterium]|nr:alanine racemase [Armatimonadota bacterium]
MSSFPSTWLEVDLAAIRNNLALIRKEVAPGAAVIAVVKANAYGHGLAAVGIEAERAGAASLGVALVDEGVQLREAGVRIPTLVMASIQPAQAAEAVRHGLTCALCEADVARALSTAAVDQGRRASVEIKLDTGMGRVGIPPDRLPSFLEESGSLPGLVVEGVFSHLSAAEEADPAYSLYQLEQLLKARCDCSDPRWRWHLSNSAAAVGLPQCRLDAVRVGLLVYGLNPLEAVAPLALEPAACWKTRVAFVKECPPGRFLSYGRAYETRSPARIATLAVGYADGYPRALSNVGEVLLGGKRAPIRGRICMDQMLVEVPAGVEARVGDEVVLMGQQGQERITAEELAERAGSITHEILARLGTRMERWYRGRRTED